MKPEVLWYWSCKLHQRKLTLFAKLLKTVNYLVYHAVLPYQAVIERDIILEHYGLGVVIHPNVTLGHRVRIFQHVTIAAETWVGSPHRVVIGDDVVIGAGACIIPSPDSGLEIGASAQVGANAVVKKPVEPGQTVVGVPAKPLVPKNLQLQ